MEVERLGCRRGRFSTLLLTTIYSSMGLLVPMHEPSRVYKNAFDATFSPLLDNDRLQHFCHLWMVMLYFLDVSMVISQTSFFLFFLGPHPQHREVPRQGLNRSYISGPTSQPQQCRIRAVSATCTAAHGNTGSLTHWVRPGIKPISSWILVGLVSTVPQKDFFFFFLS